MNPHITAMGISQFNYSILRSKLEEIVVLIRASRTTETTIVCEQLLEGRLAWAKP